MPKLLVPACLFPCGGVFAQGKTDTFLQNLLFTRGDSLVRGVLQRKEDYRLQIIYTRIDRDRNNRPYFKNFYFNADTNLYFNPASTVKLPLALLALEKIKKLNVKGLNKFTSLLIDSNYSGQTKVVADSTAENGFPSIAHYLKKAFLVSDNNAYNRLYEFVGQQDINRNLHAKGYPSVRITRQFLGLTEDENRHTNPMRFVSKSGRTIYSQPAAYNRDSFYFGKTIRIGRGYLDKHDSLINAPIDFTRVNNLPLEDLQQILQSALFPASVAPSHRFDISAGDHRFLLQYLSQYPSETNYPKYDSAEYYDSYVKFYFRSGGHSMPPYVRVFNKVGWAYGFLIDVSYVVDFKNKVEFMLASTLYVNSDGILNDDKYEYESVGWPFLYKLGQMIYHYELTRPRRYRPNLASVAIPYETRDPKDARLTLKNVDN